MAWQPIGVSLLAEVPQGQILINIINSLAREIAKLQKEIDDLKRSKK